MEPERRLHGALDQMGGVGRRLAEAALRVGAGDIEIAQRDVAEIIGPGRVLEHPFDHQLGAAIRRDRRERRVLRHRLGAGFAVNRGGRGEDERLHPALDRGLDQGARVRDVVEVVAERVADRFRHDDLGGEMGDRVDRVLLDQARDQVLVAGVADDELRALRARPRRSRSRDCRERRPSRPRRAGRAPCGRRYSRRRR